MKRYGLTGNPLGHSISPEIHRELTALRGEKVEYNMYPTTGLYNTFENELKNLDGFNITVPYKTDIMPKLYEISEEAELYNACNTVKIKDGKAYGYNTDVIGFIDCFEKRGISLKGKKILIAGAGGVSSMMAVECARQGAEVYITCRNKEKGDKLIEAIFSKTGKKAYFVNKDDIGSYDIFLQGTPLGMFPKYFDSYIPLTKLKNIPVMFDTVYNPTETLSVRICEYYGNTAIGGLRMLVSQAAKGQEIWAGNTYTNEEITDVTEAVKRFIPDFKIDKNIILVGAPGAGKSTFAREIGKILEMNIIDIDNLISEKENRSITTIFEESGEDYFRKVESEVFYETIADTGSIIAVGGGLPEYNDLSALDKTKNIVVFLDVETNELVKRVKRNNRRPLLKENPEEKLKNILARRYGIYKKCADVTVEIKADSELKDNVVKTIDLMKVSNLKNEF